MPHIVLVLHSLPEPPGQGPPEERLQMEIVAITRKCSLQEPLSDQRSPRKAYKTRLLSQESAFQILWPGAAQERLQDKIVITRKCFPEPLARGPPRKGSRTSLLLSEGAFQSLWPEVPPGKASEQDCYDQKMLFKALARGAPKKCSKTTLLLPENVFQSLWPVVPPGKAPGATQEQPRSSPGAAQEQSRGGP